MVEVLWTARSTGNAKTGDIPTAWIGGTRAESLESCGDCPLLESKRCYAQFGSAALGHGHILRARAKGARYDLATALRNRADSARAVRVSAVGDAGALPVEWYQTVAAKVRAAGLAVLAYTHQWRTRTDLAGEVMASCETPREADQAMRLGFRATVVLPSTHTKRTFRTPSGATGIVCPAIRAPGRVTCNTCRLCDGARPGPVIGFPEHGPKIRKNPTRRLTVDDWRAVQVVVVRRGRATAIEILEDLANEVPKLSMRALRNLLIRMRAADALHAEVSGRFSQTYVYELGSTGAPRRLPRGPVREEVSDAEHLAWVREQHQADLRSGGRTDG